MAVNQFKHGGREILINVTVYLAFIFSYHPRVTVLRNVGNYSTNDTASHSDDRNLQNTLSVKVKGKGHPITCHEIPEALGGRV
jgi:hypothetical protein